MFCRYCGEKVEDNSAFCSFCGKDLSKTERPINVNIRKIASLPKRQNQFANLLNKFCRPHLRQNNCTRKNKKWLCICSMIVVCVLITAGVLLFTGSIPSTIESPPRKIAAKMTDDGTAYIPLGDGTSIVINDDVSSAFCTSDREHVIVQLTDGTLYYTNKTQSEKHMISDNCLSIMEIRNDGFFFDDVDYNEYRVTFSDNQVIQLCTPQGEIISAGGIEQRFRWN